jgi:hypothetical protein
MHNSDLYLPRVYIEGNQTIVFSIKHKNGETKMSINSRTQANQKAFQEFFNFFNHLRGFLLKILVLRVY